VQELVTKLKARVQALNAETLKLGQEREQYKKLYLEILERCKLLERGIVTGKKAERFSGNEGQLALQLLGQLLGDESTESGNPVDEDGDDPKEPKPKPKPRKPTGRRPLPEHLPRVEIEIVPPEVEREGRNAFAVIGSETSELLERRPASLVIVRIVRPKFVRKGEASVDEPTVQIAEVPELPIERGLAGPGMLADTIVRRWQDHLPLHRQESIYAREGIELSRSTICSWHMQLSQLAVILVDAMYRDALNAPYLCTDATGVLVQAKERCRRGHFWVLVAPEKHVLYRYSSAHNGAAVDELLAGYKGYLVADAHSVYDHLFRDGNVTEVACRVGGDVTAPAPHRPGRAGFPHPVLRVAGSLAGAA